MADSISTEELDEIYTFAIQLGKDAGQMLMTAAESRFGDANAPGREQQSVEKDSSVDIVTQTDEGKSPSQFGFSVVPSERLPLSHFWEIEYQL